MTIEQALQEKLTVDAELLEERIYAVKLPQDVLFPAARYARISGPRDYTHSGPSGLVSARFQIDVFAENYEVCRNAFDEIKNNLSGFKGEIIKHASLDDDKDDFESETGLYRVQSDFIILYEDN